MRLGKLSLLFERKCINATPRDFFRKVGLFPANLVEQEECSRLPPDGKPSLFPKEKRTLGLESRDDG
jgi:hypothetical protein